MKDRINKRLVCAFMLMLTLVLLAGCGIKAQTSGDEVQYEGKEYAIIEYPANVFSYDYNGNSHYDIADELDYVYNIDDKEKALAVFFDDFEKTASIFKISNDGVVRGTLSIGKYKGEWYWRSEIIDESRENDGTWPEYVQPLPESLSDKICLDE